MTTPHIQTAGDSVTLGELLKAEATRTLTIRFVCAARKILNESERTLTLDEMDLAYDINRSYMSLGKKARADAHQEGQARLTATLNGATNVQPIRTPPVMLPAPEPNHAPSFTNVRAMTMLRVALKNHGSNKSITFGTVKAAVERLHLGECEWRPEELKVQSNNLKMWEMRLQNELVKLRKEDVIVYRATKGDYFIF